MDKEKFISLSIEDQIKYLNEQLNNGLGVKDIREVLGIGEKALQRIIKNSGYKYNQKLKQYIDYESNTAVMNDKSNTKVVATGNYEGNTNVVIQNEEYKNLMNIIKGYEELNSKMEEMYKWYELQVNVIDITTPTLKIEPNGDQIVVRSFKLYKNVSENFTKFCNENKTYKVQDLVSAALEEFIKKYK